MQLLFCFPSFLPPFFLCCGIILLFTVNTYCSDWFNKQAVLPIAKSNKVRRDKKTEDAGMKKGRVRESPADAERADGHTILRKGTKPRGKA